MTTLLIILIGYIVLLFVLSRLGTVGKKIAVYSVLILMALIMLIPFYLMFVMSTLKTNEIYSFPPVLTFGTNLATNWKNMNDSINLLRAFGNSCIVTFSYVILSLLFCSMGGYAFSIYDFPGKNVLFRILLATMMVPATAGMIPWFLLMSKLGWVNDFKALIIPGCANAFGIFWMRQYCKNNVPRALMEAARIDGCSEWTIFFRVIAPILLPAYAEGATTRLAADAENPGKAEAVLNTLRGLSDTAEIDAEGRDGLRPRQRLRCHHAGQYLCGAAAAGHLPVRLEVLHERPDRRCSEGRITDISKRKEVKWELFWTEREWFLEPATILSTGRRICGGRIWSAC